MKGKPGLVKASRIAAVARTIGGAFVFATRDTNLPREENASAVMSGHKFNDYTCKSCTTAFTSIAGMQPYCISCGSEHVEGSAHGVVEAKVPTDETLGSYSCASCGTLNVINEQLVTAASNELHCVTCGHGTHFVTKAESDMDQLSIDVEDSEQEEFASDETDELDDFDMIDTGDQEESASDQTVDESQRTNGADADVPASTPEEIVPKSLPQAALPEGAPNPDSTSTGDAPVQASDDLNVVDPAIVYSDEDEELDVNMLDALGDESMDGEELSLMHIGANVVIAARGQTLATLTPELAGDNADMLQSSEFAQAVSHSLATLGLKKTCAAYNFAPNHVKLSIKNLVAAKVEQELATKAEALTQKLDSAHADLSQSVDIAAAGFAKNFWKNRADPLQAALIQELSTLGVHNASKLVNNIFKQHAVAHMREVLSLAREVANRSVEARNELAQIIDLANYVPSNKKPVQAADEEFEDIDVDADDADMDSDTDMNAEDVLSSRLASPATVVTSSVLPRDPVIRRSNGKSEIAALLAGRTSHFSS